MDKIFLHPGGDAKGRAYVAEDELTEYMARAKRIEQAAREFIEHLQYPYDNIAHSSAQLEKLRAELGME